MSLRREDFVAVHRVYPPSWVVDVGTDGARMVVVHEPGGARRIRFEAPGRAPVVVSESEDGRALTCTPDSEDDQAFVSDSFERCRERVEDLVRKRDEHAASFRAMPPFVGDAFDRARFLELLHASRPNPAALSWSMDVPDAPAPATDTLLPTIRGGETPSSILFVRLRVPRGKHTPDDYQRVWVHDVDGELRWSSDAFTAPSDARGFVEDMVARAGPAIADHVRAREERIAKIVASRPSIEREALVDAITALTHGEVDVDPIANAVILAATDPRAYIREHEKACADWFVFEPVLGLHVIALLQHLPKRFVAYFDWKESMHEILPMLVRLLADGPKVSLDPAPFLDRCEAWDRRSRLPAIKEIAAGVQGAALFELKTTGDAYAIVAATADDGARASIWKKKAALPLAPLAKKSRAKR